MFIALAFIPAISLDEKVYSTQITYAIDAKTEEVALKIIKDELPPKSKRIQKALCEQMDFKEDEYFEVWYYEVTAGRKIAIVDRPTSPASGFHWPHKTIKF